jgi:hypothetical protein
VKRGNIFIRKKRKFNIEEDFIRWKRYEEKVFVVSL